MLILSFFRKVGSSYCYKLKMENIYSNFLSQNTEHPTPNPLINSTLNFYARCFSEMLYSFIGQATDVNYVLDCQFQEFNSFQRVTHFK